MKYLLTPIHRLIWRDDDRRAQLLLRFAAVEADGGHDLVRAAESTPDPVLRRLFLRHAADEARHAVLFRNRGVEILRGRELAQAITIPDKPANVERAILFGTLLAFADAVIGPHLRPMLDQPDGATRELAAKLTPAALALNC